MRDAPDRGDLIWLDHDPQVGHEQGGRRPALVLSPRAYNVRAGLALGCPITRRIKGYPFEVMLPADAAVEGTVLADHVRCFDWRARKAVWIAAAPADVVAEVTARAVALLEGDA